MTTATQDQPVIDPWALPEQTRAMIAEGVRLSYDMQLPPLPGWNDKPCLRHAPVLVPSCLNCGLLPRRHQRVGVTWLYLTPRAGLFDSTGLGKAQPLDAKVLTPSGWRLMGSLRPGDAVTDPDGEESFVEAVYPRGEMDVYRVEFSDGTSCESTLDHLWKVRSPGERRFRVARLCDIRDGLESGSHAGRPAVPLLGRAPEFAEHAELPLDPYLVGLLLGDGGLARTTPVFTTADEELLRAVTQSLPAGVRPVHAGGYDYRLVAGGRSFSGTNPLTAALRSLGMHGLLAHEKHVPLAYLYGSVKTRLAVLQGLMDTDGTASPASGAEFSSASRQLAADVAELARSLRMSVHEHEGKEVGYRYRGEDRVGRKRWRVHIRPGSSGSHVLLFRLARKGLIPLPGPRHDGVKWIRSVSYSRTAPVQCIAVSAASHLYVTDGWTVTHNTIQVAGLLALMRGNGELGYGKRALLVVRASTIGQWHDQLLRMIPDLQVTCVTGDARKRRKALAGEWEVALCGPEMIVSKASNAVEQLVEFDFHLVVCDDVNALANLNKTSRTIRRLTDPARRVVVATATPLDSRLGQLYDTGRILGWQSVLGSPEEFQHRYVNMEQVWYTPRLKPVRCRYCKGFLTADHNQKMWVDKDKAAGPCPAKPGGPHFPLSRLQPGPRFTWVEKGVNPDNLAEFRARIAPLAIRRVAAECDDVTMPEVVVSHTAVELGPAQKKRYEELRKGIITRLSETGRPVSKQESSGVFLRARQITSGLANLDAARSGESAKLDKLVDQLTGDIAGEPHVVYCYFRPTLADLAERLQKAGVQNVRIWGEQHEADQRNALRMFNSGAANVMLITDAGGMGLNLQRARRMTIVDPPLTGGRLAQIVGRVRRDGSVHSTCYVQVMVSDTPVDKAVVATLGDELEMFSAVMNADGAPDEIPWPRPEDVLRAVAG